MEDGKRNDDGLDPDEVRRSREYAAEVISGMDPDAPETVNGGVNEGAEIYAKGEHTIDLSAPGAGGEDGKRKRELEVRKVTFKDGVIDTGGDVITLVRKIGSGGEGSVYLGRRQTGIDKHIAVKLSRPDARSRSALLNEAQQTALIDHQTIVPVFAYYQGAERDFITMKYVNGPDARILTEMHDYLGVHMPPHIPAFAIWLACEGLGVVHEDEYDEETGDKIRDGALHRDVNPANVLFDRYGSPLLADFGIGMPMVNGRIISGNIAGKVGFLAPEMIEERQIGRYSDVYSLGLTLHTLLLGRNPLRRGIKSGMETQTAVGIYAENQRRGFPPLDEEVDGIKSALVEAVERASAVKVSDRTQTAPELRSELRDFLYPPGGGYGATREGTAAYISLIRNLYGVVRGGEKAALKDDSLRLPAAEVRALVPEVKVEAKRFEGVMRHCNFLRRKRRVIREDGGRPEKEDYLRLRKIGGGEVEIRPDKYVEPYKLLGDVEG